MAGTLPRIVAFILIIIGTFALLLSGDLPTATYAQQRDTSATVTRVVDGDTIEISPAIDGNEEVRLIGVDTPETKDPDTGVQPYGPQASQFTTRELDGERVDLEFDQDREDQYGRLLAYVHVGGEMFNETLLRQGYAQLYIVSPNDKYEGRFEQAQQQAKSAERGLWGLPQDQLCQLTNRGNGIGEGSPGCTGDEEPSTSDAGAGDDQYADAKDDVVPGTTKKGPLPGTGGPPLLLLPWLVALLAVGFSVLRRT
jgi:endonuclease YncB( thermonuclease family)